jgi:formate-dependent nitrite reductase membrane component NrfD
LFLASGASTGLAAIALGLALTNRSVSTTTWAKLMQADIVAMIIEIVLLVAFVVMLISTGQVPSALNLLLLIGGTLILGLIVPLVLQFRSGVSRLHAAVSMTAMIALLILAGGFIMRMAIVMGGQGLL